VTFDAPSITGGSLYNAEGEDPGPGTDTEKETEEDAGRLLKRTNSDSQFISTRIQIRSEERYPRHLSFSLAEESVLIWEEIVDTERDPYTNDARGQIRDEEFMAKEYKQLRKLISDLETTTTPFTQSQLETLQTLLSTLTSDQQTTESLYHPHEDHLHSLQTASESILRSEKERLDESLKGIETLAAKLEYEMNGLKGRVEDVDAGVGDFEKGVGRVEERVGELEKDAAKAEQGWNCAVQ
jgi:chromosome segregation ATPase